MALRLATLVSCFVLHLSSQLSISINDWLIPHNTYRCMHGVPMLDWDSCLANSAQLWANRGVFTHSNSYSLTGCEGPAGENLGLGYKSAYDTIKAWYSEVNKWNSSPKNGLSISGTGHFTVMAWKSARKIGCGYDEKSKIYVCRYKGEDNSSSQCNVPNMQGCFNTNNIPDAIKNSTICEIEARIRAGLEPSTTTTTTVNSPTDSTTTQSGDINPSASDSIIIKIVKWLIQLLTNTNWSSGDTSLLQQYTADGEINKWNDYDKNGSPIIYDFGDAGDDFNASSIIDTTESNYVPGIFTDNGLLDDSFYEDKISPVVDKLKSKYFAKDNYLLQAYESRFALIKQEQDSINSLALKKGDVSTKKAGSKVMDRIVIKLATKFVSSNLLSLLMTNVQKYIKSVLYDFLKEVDQLDFVELFSMLFDKLLPPGVNPSNMLWQFFKSNVASLLDAIVRGVLDTLLPFFTTSNVDVLSAKAASFLEAIVTVAVTGDIKKRSENGGNEQVLLQISQSFAQSYPTSSFLNPHIDPLAKSILAEAELLHQNENKYMDDSAFVPSTTSFMQIRKHASRSSFDFQHLATTNLKTIDPIKTLSDDQPLSNPYNWIPSDMDSPHIWRVPAIVQVEKENQIGSKATSSTIESSNHLSEFASLASNLSVTYSALGSPVMSLLLKIIGSVFSASSFGGMISTIVIGFLKQLGNSLFKSSSVQDSITTKVNKEIKNVADDFITLFIPSKQQLQTLVNNKRNSASVLQAASVVLKQYDSNIKVKNNISLSNVSGMQNIGESIGEKLTSAFIDNVGSHIKDPIARNELKNNVNISMKLASNSLMRAYLPSLTPTVFSDVINNSVIIYVQSMVYAITRTRENDALFVKNNGNNTTSTTTVAAPDPKRPTTTTTTTTKSGDFVIPDFGF